MKATYIINKLKYYAEHDEDISNYLNSTVHKLKAVVHAMEYGVEHNTIMLNVLFYNKQDDVSYEKRMIIELPNNYVTEIRSTRYFTEASLHYCEHDVLDHMYNDDLAGYLGTVCYIDSPDTKKSAKLKNKFIELVHNSVYADKLIALNDRIEKIVKKLDLCKYQITKVPTSYSDMEMEKFYYSLSTNRSLLTDNLIARTISKHTNNIKYSSSYIHVTNKLYNNDIKILFPRCVDGYNKYGAVIMSTDIINIVTRFSRNSFLNYMNKHKEYVITDRLLSASLKLSEIKYLYSKYEWGMYEK